MLLNNGDITISDGSVNSNDNWAFLELVINMPDVMYLIRMLAFKHVTHGLPL
jgi:hypothetical protein